MGVNGSEKAFYKSETDFHVFFVLYYCHFPPCDSNLEKATILMSRIIERTEKASGWLRGINMTGK